MNHARGFTLVELMVAVLVLTVGVLALAGTAAAVTRIVSWGQRRSGSAIAAQARLEVLRAGGCAPLGSGCDSVGPYHLRWSVTTAGSLRTIALTVDYPDERGVRSEPYEAAAWCP